VKKKRRALHVHRVIFSILLSEKENRSNRSPYVSSGSTIKAGGGLGTPVFTDRTQPSDPSASWKTDVSGRSKGIVNSVTEIASIAHGA